MKKILTYFILVFLSLHSLAQTNVVLQPNQYEISVGGDTINRTDKNGERIGLWSIYFESRYGDDSYYEVGNFIDNSKNGEWKMYSKNGRLLRVTNYYNGHKNGEVKFYENGRLVCVGQYKALRTDAAYDTILVEDPLTNELNEKIIPTSRGSVRHGLWVYYKPPYKEIKRIEEFQWDEKIYEQDYVTRSDSIAMKNRIAKYPHLSGKLPPGIWGSKKNQKAPRYTDFPENAKYIKPNVRKKKVEH